MYPMLLAPKHMPRGSEVLLILTLTVRTNFAFTEFSEVHTLAPS
jgi:hypothetical protein